MKILLFGATGQVGHFLMSTLAELGELATVDRAAVDLLDSSAIEEAIDRVSPDLIVNAAAYTAVDQAEKEPAVADAINGVAPGVMARRAAQHGALFVHYSTDYVFNGEKQLPYIEGDPVAPLNAYGRSKLIGERAVMDAGAAAIILRTTWVYAPRGKNFVKTILRLAAERDELKIVADQFGAPTSAIDIAHATATLAKARLESTPRGDSSSKIYHLTGQGRCSWHEFAEEIVAQWRTMHGRGALRVQSIEPIASSAFPTPAPRPLNSSLSNDLILSEYGIQMPPWQKSLGKCLGALS